MQICLKTCISKLLGQLGPHERKTDKTQNKSSCLFIRFYPYFSMSVFCSIGQHIELKRTVKMHTILEYDGKLPVYVNITKEVLLITRGKHSFGKGQSLLQTDSITIFNALYLGQQRCFLRNKT